MISDEDMATIARKHLIYWELLRPYLGLSRTKEEEIVNSYHKSYGKQKYECLYEWKVLKGNEATYRALITAAGKAGDQLLADEVRAMVTSIATYSINHFRACSE